MVAKKLGQIANAPPRLAVANWRAQEATGPRSGPNQPEQELHRGRLSGAVWTQKAKDLAARHSHGQASQRLDPTVALRQILDLDCRRGRRLEGLARGHCVSSAHIETILTCST